MDTFAGDRFTAKQVTERTRKRSQFNEQASLRR
jgi:hypothetical protein